MDGQGDRREQKESSGSVAPAQHLVQVYENERAFLDTLEGYVAGGLRADEGVVVIATPEHLDAIEARLQTQHIDLDAARSTAQYTSLDAEELLAQFMVDGWPDKDRFQRLIVRLLQRARGTARKVRAFGEMVVLLARRGDYGATVRLEYLWNELCQAENLTLLCAYPKTGFAGASSQIINELVALHSGVVSPPLATRSLADLMPRPGTRTSAE